MAKRTKAGEGDAPPLEAKNEIELGGRKFTLTMPRGRAGRKNIIRAQRSFENLMTVLGDVQSIDQISGVYAMQATRVLFDKSDEFETFILPFMLENTTESMGKEEALDFLDRIADSPMKLMEQFIIAMFFYLAGENPEALEEAVGKSEDANQE